MDSSDAPRASHDLALHLLLNTSHVVGIIPQMVVYGIYTLVFCVAMRLFSKQGIHARKFLFGISIFMYLLSTSFMAISIIALLRFIRISFDISTEPPAPSFSLPLYSSIWLLNIGFTDAVVIWRVRTLCKESKKTFFACLIVFLVAFCGILTIIAVQILTMFTSSKDTGKLAGLKWATDSCHVIYLVFSLVVNLITTSMVSLKAWRSREMFSQISNNGIRILFLLIESGALYSLSLLIGLICTVTHLQVGSLGDLYIPINVQFAGMYPLIVFIIISHDQSLDKTTREGTSTNFTSVFVDSESDYREL